jgi:hypothetical protein
LGNKEEMKMEGKRGDGMKCEWSQKNLKQTGFSEGCFKKFGMNDRLSQRERIRRRDFFGGQMVKLSMKMQFERAK